MPGDVRETFSLKSSGAQTVGANKDTWAAAFSGQIIGVIANVTTAPVGAALNFDILKNGTTIYSGTKPTIADGASKEAAVAAPDETHFSAGDVFALSVLQIGSGTAGSNLDVTVEYVSE